MKWEFPFKRTKEEEPQKTQGRAAQILRTRPSVKPSEHTLAKAVAVAAALHAPLIPQIKEAADRIMHGVTSFEQSWFEKNTVIHPQSETRKAQIAKQVEERKARIDIAKVDTYKQDMAERLDRGEHVSFKELYFALEQLNGVPAEEVQEAKRHAESLIERYAAEVGASLDQNEIKHIVEEMYGPESRYDWAQGSVTTYFRTGKRNCVAIDRAQHIVFEGILERLPESERSAWSLEETHEKQHVIATLVHRKGAPDQTTYMLEPGIRTSKSVKSEAGTARVTAQDLKKGTVGAKTGMKSIRAEQGAPGEVAPSPDIDVVTDQPFASQITIEGDLRGAAFNLQESEREGVRIEQRTQEKVTDVTEVELLEPESADAATVEKIFRQVEEHSGRDHLLVATRELRNPSTEALDTLQRLLDSRGARVEGLMADQLNDWSSEALQRFVTLRMSELAIPLMDPSDTKNVVDPLIAAVEESARKGRGSPQITRLSVNTFDSGMTQHIPATHLRRLFRAFDRVQEIQFEGDDVTQKEIEMFRDTRIPRINVGQITYFPGSLIGSREKLVRFGIGPEEKTTSLRLLRALNAVGRIVIIDGMEYFRQLSEQPELVALKNIEPDWEKINDAELNFFWFEIQKGQIKASDKIKQDIQTEMANRKQKRLYNGVHPGYEP